MKQIVERVFVIAPTPLPVNIRASVRARLQERCAGSAIQKKQMPVLFESVHGIAARRGEWRLLVDPLGLGNPDAVQDGADAFIEAEEGRAALRIHLRRERSRKLIENFKARLQSLACCACGFDFEKVYGELGKGYIEAHHTVPVAQLDDGAKTRIEDLVPLCANCHRVVHRRGLLPVEQLKAQLAAGASGG